jgi:hypothetical protein
MGEDPLGLKTASYWLNFTNIFGAKADQLLHRQFLMLFMATPFGKNVLKCGAQCKSCNLNMEIKFMQKCW